MPKVTFIVDGRERVVEFAPGSLEYTNHGIEGSLLDIALNQCTRRRCTQRCLD
jgi:hypothetical protein